MNDWAQIVREYGPIVWKTAYRLLGVQADVNDCFQDTFLCAWKQSQLEPIRNWPGFLKRLATTRALDRLRARSRDGAQLSQLSDTLDVISNVSEPYELAQSSELAEHLRCALAIIDERQAEVFCLACVEEMEYRQISQQLDISVNYVGVLLNRAKTNLRDHLCAHAPIPSARNPNKQEEGKERP
jgi:RNA polymerase sigma-70 factor (ECF subfamily)